MCSNYKNGRVYIAPSNNFTVVSLGLTPADTSMTEFFSAFDSKTREGGDFEWSIATAAYAYSRTFFGYYLPLSTLTALCKNFLRLLLLYIGLFLFTI